MAPNGMAMEWDGGKDATIEREHRSLDKLIASDSNSCHEKEINSLKEKRKDQSKKDDESQFK